MEEYVAVSRARELILAGAAPPPVERVAVTTALGRVLAAAVRAEQDIPPLDNSAMDGYGLRSRDVQEAAPGKPVRLRVVAEIPAGRFYEGCVGPGEAVRIMTGAPIPRGVDAVIRREWVEEGDDQVVLTRPVAAGNDLRRAGEDVAAGAVVLRAGQLVTPAVVGMLAAVGRPYVEVYARPRVAVIATGDEIVDFPDVPGPGMIRNSNSYSLAALVTQAGGVPLRVPLVRDDLEELRRVVAEAAAACDLVLTTGGVSMGDYDFVRRVLDQVAGGIVFWKVKMKPGKPLVYGRVGSTPLVGLPGNPVSVMVSFEQFVRPLMRKMSGRPESQWFLPRRTAIAGEDLPGAGRRCHYLRGLLRENEAGGAEVFLTGPQGSGILSSMVRGNCLVVLPPGDGVRRGEPVTVEMLDYGQ